MKILSKLGTMVNFLNLIVVYIHPSPYRKSPMANITCNDEKHCSIEIKDVQR